MVCTLIKAFKPLSQCGNKAPKYQDLNCDTGYKVSIGKRKRREDSEGEDQVHDRLAPGVSAATQEINP